MKIKLNKIEEKIKEKQQSILKRNRELLNDGNTIEYTMNCCELKGMDFVYFLLNKYKKC